MLDVSDRKERHKVVALEKDDVQMFALERLALNPRAWTWTQELMEAYKQWRVASGKGPTCLNLDAFGRFLPKLGEASVRSRDGVQLRAIDGVEIRQ